MQTKGFLPQTYVLFIIFYIYYGGRVYDMVHVWTSEGNLQMPLPFFCGPQGLNSGHPLWWQVTLHIEPCCQPIVAYTYSFLPPTAICLRVIYVRLPFLGALEHEASSAPCKGDLSPRNTIANLFQYKFAIAACL